MEERTVRSKEVFKGRLLGLEVLEVEVGPGVRSTREIVRHPGAVAVLAELPDGQFVLVRQYRKPVEHEVLEIVAGGLERGESPEACAAREVREETGYAVRKLEKLGILYPAPGYTDERIHVFHAALEPSASAPAPESDEHVTAVLLSGAEIEAMLRAGGIQDAKTLAAWLLHSRMHPERA